MRITVNAKPLDWPKETITYEEIVELAGKKGDYYSVTFFAKGKDKWTVHEGFLYRGQSAPVWENMHIDCHYTGNA